MLSIGFPGLLVLLLRVLVFLAVILRTGLVYQVDYTVLIQILALGTAVLVPSRLYPLGSDVKASILLLAIGL